MQLFSCCHVCFLLFCCCCFYLLISLMIVISLQSKVNPATAMTCAASRYSICHCCIQREIVRVCVIELHTNTTNITRKYTHTIMHTSWSRLHSLPCLCIMAKWRKLANAKLKCPFTVLIPRRAFGYFPPELRQKIRISFAWTFARLWVKGQFGATFFPH